MKKKTVGLAALFLFIAFLLLFSSDVRAMASNWIVDGDYLIFNSGLGGTDVGVTQGLVGGVNTMEFTTADTSGDQATRLMMRGGGDAANIEFFTGARGAESLSMAVLGSTGNVNFSKNVGIGTTSPDAPLHVTRESSGNILNLEKLGAGNSTLLMSSTGSANQILSLEKDSTQRLELNSFWDKNNILSTGSKPLLIQSVGTSTGNTDANAPGLLMRPDGTFEFTTIQDSSNFVIEKANSGGTQEFVMRGQDSSRGTNQSFGMQFVQGDSLDLSSTWNKYSIQGTSDKDLVLGTNGRNDIEVRKNGDICIGTC